MRFAAIGQDFPVFRLRFESRARLADSVYVQAVDEADAREWLTRSGRVERIHSCAPVTDFEARVNMVWFSGTVQQAAA